MPQTFTNWAIYSVQGHQFWDLHRCLWRYWQASNLYAWFSCCAYVAKHLRFNGCTSRFVSPGRRLHLLMLTSLLVSNHLSRPIQQQWIAHSAYYLWTNSSISQCSDDLKTKIIRIWFNKILLYLCRRHLNHNTYLVELHFFKTTVSLLFIFHVEYLDQFQRYYFLIWNQFSFEYVRKLSLAYFC